MKDDNMKVAANKALELLKDLDVSKIASIQVFFNAPSAKKAGPSPDVETDDESQTRENDEESDEKTCEDCGHECEDDDKYCPQCGGDLASPESQPEPSQSHSDAPKMNNKALKNK